MEKENMGFEPLWLVYERLTDHTGNDVGGDLAVSAHRTIEEARDEAERLNVANSEINLSYFARIMSIPLIGS